MTNTDSDKLAVKDLELLICSASDYAKNQGRELTAYEFVGINVLGDAYSDTLRYMKSQAQEKNCEVIVDMKYVAVIGWGTQSRYQDTRHQISGTGLRLKKNDP